MNRRDFTAIFGGSAVFLMAGQQHALAYRNTTFTCVSDNSLIIPSPISYEIQTCANIREIAARYSNIESFAHFGGTDQNVDMRRKEILGALVQRLSDIETTAGKLSAEIATLDRRQADEQFKMLKTYASFVSTVVVSLSVKSPKLLLFGSLFLAAYAASDYALQVIFKEDDAIDAISFVTNTRNSLISVIPLVTDYTLDKGFGYYALVHEIVWLSAATWIMYDNYRINGKKLDLVQSKLQSLANKAAQLRNFANQHLSNNSDFLATVDQCRRLSSQALKSFAEGTDERVCRGLPKVNALEFFERFDFEAIAYSRSEGRAIP
jgi:hypothetical protein